MGELEIMKNCDHPNVLTCFGAFIHVFFTFPYKANKIRMQKCA